MVNVGKSVSSLFGEASSWNPRRAIASRSSSPEETSGSASVPLQVGLHILESSPDGPSSILLNFHRESSDQTSERRKRRLMISDLQGTPSTNPILPPHRGDGSVGPFSALCMGFCTVLLHVHFSFSFLSLSLSLSYSRISLSIPPRCILFLSNAHF